METTENQSVIGYKAFNNDMTCMNKFQYEVGKTYITKEPIQLCESGFHFCMIPIDVLKYYKNKNNKFAIIKATGKIVHDYDKSVCSQITIEKLITLDELYNLPNGIVKYNGRIFYYQNGKLHREEDGPTVEYTFGEKRWYINGLLHRKNGPAIEYANGDKEWYLNGLLHREDGPAFYKRMYDGDKKWYINGLLHREYGPAIEDANGTKEWYINGIRHRENGPAVERANGDKEWYINGKLHRENGPAIEDANGYKAWYKNGILHREDGPAIEYVSGLKVWYKNGKLHRENGPSIEENNEKNISIIDYIKSYF